MNGSLISGINKYLFSPRFSAQPSPGDIICPGLVLYLTLLLLSLSVFTQRPRIVAYYPRLLFQVVGERSLVD